LLTKGLIALQQIPHKMEIHQQENNIQYEIITFFLKLYLYTEAEHVPFDSTYGTHSWIRSDRSFPTICTFYLQLPRLELILSFGLL